MAVRYKEGDWFAVPLRSGGFGLVLVARANPKAALLGYFFGPRFAVQPTLDDVKSLRAEHAVFVGKFGHLGIRDGKWPSLGRIDGWDRKAWPMPLFARYEELTGRTVTVRYDENDPAHVLNEEVVAGNVAADLPDDGLMGAGFVELRLTRLLA